MRDLRFFAPRRPLEPCEDGYNWIYYYVEDISSPTMLMNYVGTIDGGYVIVDGVRISNIGSGNRKINYTFSEPGIHLLKYKESDGGGYNRFRGCSTIVEAYLCKLTGTTTGPFANCSQLTKVELPDDLTELNISSVFANCYSVSFNTKNVTTVTGTGWTGGVRVEMPNVESIPQNFCRASGGNHTLEYIDIGPNILTILPTPFFGCTKLTTIICRATTPPTGSDPFYRLDTDYTVYVPYSSDHSILDAYKAATNWASAASRIYELCANGEIPIIFADAAVETICVNNFGTDIAHFPRKDAETVTSSQLGTTFQGNTQITSFDELQYFINVRELYNNAFSGCSSLTSIVLPNSLTTVGSAVFSGCTSLTHVVVPPSVTSINLNTFNQSGDGTGTIDIQCDISIDANKNPGITLNYANVVFSDIVYNNSVGYPLINASPDIVTLKLKSWNSNRHLYYSGSSAYSQIMFVEIEETFSGTLWYTMGQNGLRAVGDGCIIHLAYSGVAGTRSDIGAQMGRIAKIYVGDGSSQASDQAVLDLYLADTDWAQYASKLDLWYNYSGTYKQ